MTQQLHVAGLPRVTEDGYFDAANANKSWVRVHGGQSSEFPIYPTTRERTINSGQSDLHNVPRDRLTAHVELTRVNSTCRARISSMCFFKHSFLSRIDILISWTLHRKLYIDMNYFVQETRSSLTKK